MCGRTCHINLSHADSHVTCVSCVSKASHIFSDESYSLPENFERVSFRIDWSGLVSDQISGFGFLKIWDLNSEIEMGFVEIHEFFRLPEMGKMTRNG